MKETKVLTNRPCLIACIITSVLAVALVVFGVLCFAINTEITNFLLNAGLLFGRPDTYFAATKFLGGVCFVFSAISTAVAVITGLLVKPAKMATT